jgi:hypothetical protein
VYETVELFFVDKKLVDHATEPAATISPVSHSEASCHWL